MRVMQVQVGSTVKVRDATGVDTWTIVEAGRSDPAHGWISEECAMAVALLGHKAGERVRVGASRKNWYVTIESIESNG
jgi:transcription elongation GreA/GreB family factor